jgi:O-antigen ligase
MNRVLERLLTIYVILLPFEYLYEVVWGFSSILKPYRIVGIFILTIFTLTKLHRQESITFSKNVGAFFFIFAYGFTAALAFNIFGDGRLDYALNTAMLILFSFSIFVILDDLGISLKKAKELFFIFSVSLTISIVLYLIFSSADYLSRFSGFYRNPNNFGLACSIAIITFIYFLTRDQTSIIARVFLGLAVVFLLFAFYSSGSRASMFALFLAFISLFWSTLNLRKIVLVVTMFSMFYMLTPFLSQMLPTKMDYIAHRYSIESLQTGAGRLDIWKNATNVAMDHLFIGIGMGQYRSIHLNYIKKSGFSAYNTIMSHDLVTHSDFFDLLTNYGIISLLIYFIFVYHNGKYLLSIKAKKDEHSILVSTFFCIILFGFFRESFTAPEFWLFLGLTTCVRPFSRQGAV